MNNIFARPSSTFAGFNGQLMQGTWTLRVQDVANGDLGVINSWCLIPTLSSPNILVSPKVFLEGLYSTGTGPCVYVLRLSLAASLLRSRTPAFGYAFHWLAGSGRRARCGCAHGYGK
ncbi:MAG: proprotein convertase P-domain-containing protein [Flavobacteriales bacterium]|nr:proprotein convertase P-domain-containing protein [Flavobacteriales bacterium]